MTPEGKVKKRVKDVLKEHGAYWFMPVQSGYGAATVDFLVCANGFFVGIETKAGRGEATQRQLITMEQIHQAGGVTLVINEHNLHELKELLAICKSNYTKTG
jgi:hypothetical protein